MTRVPESLLQSNKRFPLILIIIIVMKTLMIVSLLPLFSLHE